MHTPFFNWNNWNWNAGRLHSSDTHLYIQLFQQIIEGVLVTL